MEVLKTLLTKNANPDKYMYSGYVIGFDSCWKFSLTDGSVDRNVIIFGVDMSSFLHIGNKGKNILILGDGQAQELDDTTIITEA